MRYHVVFETSGSGGYSEFTADDDTVGLAEAESMTRTHGRIVSFGEIKIGLVDHFRPVPFGENVQSA